jgi:hypothetical protein
MRCLSTAKSPDSIWIHGAELACCQLMIWLLVAAEAWGLRRSARLFRISRSCRHGLAVRGRQVWAVRILGGWTARARLTAGASGRADAPAVDVASTPAAGTMISWRRW